MRHIQEFTDALAAQVAYLPEITQANLEYQQRLREAGESLGLRADRPTEERP